MLRFAPLTAVVLLLAAPAIAVEPDQVVETAVRLDSRSLDASRAFVADGQVLERPGLVAVFEEGRFVPIVRDDGRVVGLLFDGVGAIKFVVPAGVETANWQAGTNNAPLETAIGAAVLRFSDSTLDDLQGERTWDEASDPTGANFRTFEARTNLLDDPLWTRWAPNLVVDQLRDLYGGGHVGGHLLAEFRVAGGASWLSYLFNPRGALLPGETTAIYSVRRLGGAPPEMDVYASFGSSPEAVKSYDVATTSLDVTFPTRNRGNRNLVDADVVASVELVALRADAPLKAVVFELEAERLLCVGESDRERLKITRVVDGDGTKLAAVHRGSRLFVPLARPLAPGEAVTLEMTYGGAMTQGVPIVGSPDTHFTPLGPWAWYPRNPYLDRFGSRVEVHLPRFLSAVAPGNLTEQRKENEGWHFVYEEPSGVRNLTLVVGDLIVNKESDQGSNPRIMVWFGSGMEKQLPDAAVPIRGMLDFIASIWGPYPYTTLHVVENVPYPAANWSSSGAESGSWSCTPPGQTLAWQGWVEGPTGMVLSNSPTTAPTRTLPESRVIDRLLVTPIESGKSNRFADLTRQWWGHMVPPATPRDIWIPEAMVQWTALLFARVAIGDGALKERVSLMRTEMVEAVDQTAPLASGELLGPGFAPQVWGRGPLLIGWLVERMDARVFKTMMTTLINRGVAEGVSTEQLVEIVSSVSDSGTSDQLLRAISTNALPSVSFNLVIDKDRGEVVVVFVQSPETFVPVDINVQLVNGPKDKVNKVVHLTQARTVVRWTLDDLPKKLVVDPMKSALVASLDKDAKIEIPAAEPAAEEASP